MLWLFSPDFSLDYLVVGIGNPGSEYRLTRHNVGFQVVEAIAKRWHIHKKMMRFRGLLKIVRVNGQTIGLLKPLTYVNSSGRAVLEALKKTKLPLERLLIVLDDVSLPLGKLRLRPKGSDGGHKGLRSIIQALNSDQVPRLRIGVGIPPSGIDLTDFVLSPFSSEEKPLINEAIENAIDAIQVWVTEGLEVAMRKFN